MNWKVGFSQAEKAAGLCAGLYNLQRMFCLFWEWIRKERECRKNEIQPNCGAGCEGKKGKMALEWP